MTCMPPPEPNPYLPPRSLADSPEKTPDHGQDMAANAGTGEAGLRRLLYNSVNHRRLLLIFALVYLLASAGAFFADGTGMLALIVVLNIWLMVCSWWLLDPDVGPTPRVLLCVVALVPVLNLLVPVISHVRLCDFSRVHNIPVATLGPAISAIQAGLQQPSHRHDRR